MNAGSPYAPRYQPEKELDGEREKERKKNTGEPGFHGTDPGPSLYFQKGLLYLDLYIEGNERCKVMQNQPKHSSSFALIKTQDFFLQTFPIDNVVYIIFWPWRPVDIL